MRAGIEVDGADHAAPHVVLALGVRGVADADRPRVVVPGQVIQRRLLQRPLAVHAVHDLQVAALRLGHIGDEVEEVVGLPVEAERVQRPQRRRGVADPGVAVVPVPHPAGGLRQRRRRGRHDRPGGRERQPLQGERAALQEAPPRMIGKPAAVQPVLPVVGGPGEPGGGLLEGTRWRVLAPPQRDKAGLPLLEQRARGGERSLEPDVQIGDQPQRALGARGAGDRLVVALAGVLPLRRVPAVVEHRVAVHAHLHLPVDAADQAQQHAVGLVVGGCPPVGARALVVVVPGPHQQCVGDHQPAARCPPARLEDHRPWDVAPGGRYLDAGRVDAERAGVAVENRPEHAGGIHARQAQPLDATVWCDQSGRLAVRQEPVVPDRRELAAAS